MSQGEKCDKCGKASTRGEPKALVSNVEDSDKDDVSDLCPDCFIEVMGLSKS